MRLAIVSAVAFQLTGLVTFSNQAIADETTAIVPVERWSSLFGNKEVSLHFRIVPRKETAAIDGRILWQYAANQRTLDRGEFDIDRKDNGEAEIVLRIPEVRVIFETELTVGYVPRGENAETASLSRNLWLFPEDPFFDQREALKAQKLLVFDPEGQTARLFDEIKLPHERMRNAVWLEAPGDHPYVIVGEGTSLIRNRGLGEQLLDLAAAGGTVLMLAPSGGVIPLPEQDNATQPGELRFCQHNVIREFDKRLDSEFLPGNVDFAGSKVSFRTRLSRTGMDVSEDGTWPWFTIDYPDTKGRFIFCGFELVKHWNNGPTPRFLLHRILTAQADRTPHSRD